MMGFGFGAVGLLVMGLFLVAIVALAVWLVGSVFPKGAAPSLPKSVATVHDSSASPPEILKLRYARGEISRAEYEEMSRYLQG